MQLYFFRHAIADDSTPNRPDAERELTSKGVKRTRRAAKMVKALGVNPARLFSSPLVRARQTADILADGLGVEVVVRNEVGPGFSVAAVEALIAGLEPQSEVMFVGHEPDMSGVVSALIGGGSVVMKRGGLARVDVVSTAPLRGQLVWLLAPGVLNLQDG